MASVRVHVKIFRFGDQLQYVFCQKFVAEKIFVIVLSA